MDNASYTKLVKVIRNMPLGTSQRVLARRKMAADICNEFEISLEQFMATVKGGLDPLPTATPGEGVLMAIFPNSGRRAFAPLSMSDADLVGYFRQTAKMGATNWARIDDLEEWPSLHEGRR